METSPSARHNALLYPGSQASSLVRQVAAEQPDFENAEPLPPSDGLAPTPTGAPAPFVQGDVETATLTLIEAIEQGLARNPDLIALRQQDNVGRAAVDVASVYPFNPILQTRILPYGRASNGNPTAVYNYVLFWQTFELARQRQYRTENAAAASQGVRWNIAQAEVQNLALTEQLYFTALYQHDLWQVAQENQRQSEQLATVVQKQLDAGAASAADAAQVRLDAQAARQQQRLAEANYHTAMEALRVQLNIPPSVPLVLKGDLEQYQWLPAWQAAATGAMSAEEEAAVEGSTTAAESLQQIAAQLAAVRPDVLAAQSNVEAARANTMLARASRVPNLQAGPFYVRDASGTTNLGLQAQFEVPVANGGRPLVRQRNAEFAQQATTHSQLQARAQVEAETALQRYERARALLADAKHGVADDLPAELQRLEDLYLKGEIDITRLAQSRASLLQLRRTFLDSLNEVAQAAAAVPQATGLPPHVLIGAANY